MFPRGTFRLVSSTNFEEYLVAMRVEEERRRHMVYTEIRFNNQGDVWNMLTNMSVRGGINFRLGVEFDEKTQDNRLCRTTFTNEEEGKLVQVQIYDVEDIITKIVRKFTDNFMTETWEGPGDVIATRIFNLRWC